MNKVNNYFLITFVYVNVVVYPNIYTTFVVHVFLLMLNTFEIQDSKISENLFAKSNRFLFNLIINNYLHWKADK